MNIWNKIFYKKTISNQVSKDLLKAENIPANKISLPYAEDRYKGLPLIGMTYPKVKQTMARRKGWNGPWD